MGPTTWRRALAAAVAYGFVLLLQACGGDDDGGGPQPPPAVASIGLSPASASVDVGAAATLTAQALDAAGAPIAGVSFAWASSDIAVAVVSGGQVTGVKPGNAVITASAGGVTSAAVAVTVRAAPSPSASSEVLIEQALAAGTIDAETALVYRTYAAFDATRLPDEFRGGVVGQHSEVLTEVLQRYASLSAATQARLLPYLQRPSDRGSWLDPAVRAAVAPTPEDGRRRALAINYRRCLGGLIGWSWVEGQTSKVRVWFDVDKAGQQELASAVVRYVENEVYPALIGRAGFKPPADDSATLCSGGDGKLDIYLVAGLGNRGETVPDTLGDHSSPVYILIRDSLDETTLKHALSHEYMHAIHWAYTTKAKQDDYGWFRDAIANWATDHVYPGNDSLLDMAACHLKSPDLPLESRATGYCGGSVKRDYGAYLPLRYFEKTLGVAAVRGILAATETYASAAEAMDKTLPDGLAKHWPLFGARLWNREATDQVYGQATFKGWDGLDSGVGVHEPVLAPDRPDPVRANLAGLPKDETAIGGEVEHLSNRYYHFTFSDEATRSLMFHNTFQPLRKQGTKIAVRAFYKAEGGRWKEEDWSDYEWIGFCRDAKQQRLSDLVIVVSSAEWQAGRPKVRANEPPKLMRNNIGCWGFKGTAKRVFSQESWNGGKSEVFFSPDYDYHPGGTPNQFTDQADGRLRVPIAAPLFAKGTWRLLEGFTDTPCSFALDHSGTSTTIALGGDAASSMIINVFAEAMPEAIRQAQQSVIGAKDRAYHINGVSQVVRRGTVTGPADKCPTTYDSGINAWLMTNLEAAQAPTVRADGSMKGRFSPSQAGDSSTEVFEWDLVPVREP